MIILYFTKSKENTTKGTKVTQKFLSHKNLAFVSLKMLTIHSLKSSLSAYVYLL